MGSCGPAASAGTWKVATRAATARARCVFMAILSRWKSGVLHPRRQIKDRPGRTVLIVGSAKPKFFPNALHEHPVLRRPPSDLLNASEATRVSPLLAPAGNPPLVVRP